MTRKLRQLQWHRASKQWCKRHKGKLHYLGAGTPTRDGSTGRLDEQYDEALERWEAIKATQDAHNESRNRDQRLDELEVEMRLAPSLDQHAALRHEAQILETGATVAQADAEARLLAHLRLLAGRAATPEDWRQVAQAVETMGRGRSPEERTVAKQAAEFLSMKLRQARATQRTISRYINLKTYVEQFRDWVGGETPVDTINATTLRAYYDHCLGRIGQASDAITPWGAKDIYQCAKQFVRWLAESEVIGSLPANINSREMIFSMPPGKKKYFTIAEFRNLLEHAYDRTKLFLLLMANCGMTQKDIADLRQDEVDWRRGLIRRKRSKTSRFESVEVVTYLLWPETLELLKTFGQRLGDRVLPGKLGNPLVYDDIKPDGKPVSVDAVASAYTRLLHLPGVWVTGKTLTDLRNTSATLLKNSDYHHLVALFLGHASRTTADRHYAADYDNRLNEALEFLRRQYLLRELTPEEVTDAAEQAEHAGQAA